MHLFRVGLVSLLIGLSVAQQGGGGGNQQQPPSNNDDTDTPAQPPANTPANTPTRTAGGAAATTAAPANTRTTAAGGNRPTPAQTDEIQATITGGPQAGGADNRGANPTGILNTLSGGTSDPSNAGPTDLPDPDNMPKIAGGFVLPQIQIPPTSNAPFMQKSKLPEGTVFIAVGAGLGLCILIIFLWRALVAWSLHRSVNAPLPVGLPHHKLGKKQPPHSSGKGPSSDRLYAAAHSGSQLSLDHLTSSGRSPAPNGSGLFFSPTGAPLMGPSTSTPANRGSGFYPAGYYGGPGARQSIGSFRGLMAAGGVPQPGISPPGTPQHGPTSSRGTERAVGVHPAMNMSESSLNLPPTGRAPSAVLEDLFESGAHAGTQRYH